MYSIKQLHFYNPPLNIRAVHKHRLPAKWSTFTTLVGIFSYIKVLVICMLICPRSNTFHTWSVLLENNDSFEHIFSYHEMEYLHRGSTQKKYEEFARSRALKNVPVYKPSSVIHTLSGANTNS